MNNSTKTILGVLAIVILGFLIFRGGGNESQSIIVKVGYLPVVHALPLYVAQEKGYFMDEGIEIEITKFEAPNQIIDALLSGQIHISMAGATGITAVAESRRPNSLRIFAVAGGDSQHIADGLIIQKDSVITSVEELRSKKVGTLPGIQWKTIARNLFAAHGLDIDKDLTLVELAIPLQAQALLSKQIDALLTIEPVLTVAKSLDASKTLIESPNLAYIANPFYAGVGNVSVSFMNEHSAIFKKVIKVLDRATKEINQNPNDYRKYLKNYTPLTTELVSSVNLPIYKMSSDMSVEDVLAVQKFIDVFVEYGVIKNPIKAADLVIK